MKFDGTAYVKAVEAAAKEMGVRNLGQVADEVGTQRYTLYSIRGGRKGGGMNASTLVALFDWSGVDPRPFLKEEDRADT